MRLKSVFGREAWKTLSHQTQTEAVKNSLEASLMARLDSDSLKGCHLLVLLCSNTKTKTPTHAYTRK